MKTAALIVAAGKSSRMGDFKPLLPLGSSTIVERIISNFNQAGIKDIIMITGHNAQKLERHLSNYPITFLRNEHYGTTQMFDSVRIGLEYLKDKADLVFFCPVDVPLFSSQTLEKMMKQNKPLMVPICRGVTGHPIAIHTDLIPLLLSMPDDQGLKGAMDQCGIEISYVEVSDPGTSQDTDTPEDYQKLLKLYKERACL